jgi:hypothetical protein
VNAGTLRGGGTWYPPDFLKRSKLRKGGNTPDSNNIYKVLKILRIKLNVKSVSKSVGLEN